MTDEDRFDRQIRFFGREGQEKIRALSVGIVGVGGLGSHLVQQLAHLGVARIAVIDPDIVSSSNLNRLIGVNAKDLEGKTSKTSVARRLANYIDPSIETVEITDTVISKESFQALKKADFVFGCVDNDGPRLMLTEFCAAYKRPYFDLATQILPGHPPIYGGRSCFSFDGQGCLVCLDQLSPQEAREYFLSDPSKRDEDAIYGVPRGGLNGKAPSVVSLNGVIASLAATEFMVEATGLRRARQILSYHAEEGKVFAGQDKPTPDCFYCKSVYGSGSKANVERYLNLS
jgi:molybdopterin-synthase adenylyltransferase